MSRNVKAEFCVVIGEGARISHIVSRDIKAEFCVVIGGGGANITHSEQRYQS